MFSRLYLISAVVVIVTAVTAIPVNPPVLPQRDPTTGQRVNSTSSANNTTPTGLNTTIANVTITGTEGAQAACDRGIVEFCLEKRVVTPTLPQRNATSGARVNSTSSANNTNPTGLNTTINNVTITGTNGAQAACDRGITQWCTDAPVVPVTKRDGEIVKLLNSII
ncbi:hypothetical protein BC835DRAFT_451052 [Cytidiella melzeri]|nr:hypothetical protein BC835DRAFT_451052 [Cytidiella melzeri]